MEIWLVVESGCLVMGVLLLVFAEMMVISAAPKALQNAQNELAEQKSLLDLQTSDDAKATVQKEVNKREKRVADYREITDDIGKVLAFSDAPIALAFGAIFLLVCVHALGLMGDGSSIIPPFIAGAVAFQLLYSNFVFYLEANGAFPGWARKKMPLLESLTPMIQGRPASAEDRLYPATDKVEKE